MSQERKTKFYLVEQSVLPEVFIKVTEAKALLETGEAKTISDAVTAVGISRSAFYKYKDCVSPFVDMKHGNIITFHVLLRDRMGVLSSVLAIFAESGANILTINQSIPVNATASVTISAETADIKYSAEELRENIEKVFGVIRIEITAG